MNKYTSLILIVFLLAALPFTVRGDALEILTDEPQAMTPSADYSDFHYESAIRTAKIRNRSDRPIRIANATFNISQFVVDDRPRLIYQLSPLLDVLLVRITNLGWGPYPGGDFFLFPESTRTQDGALLLREVFDLTTSRMTVPRVEKDALLVYKIGENAVPFRFASFDKLDLRLAQKPSVRDGLDQFESTTSYAARLVSEMRSGPPFKYSGVETFTARLRTPRSHEFEAPLLARRWQLVQMNPRERRLDSLLDAGIEGSLYNYWTFVFGNAVIKPVYETRTGLSFGFTVDLGDGDQKSYECSIDRLVGPDEELDVLFEFTTNKSASFDVNVTCSYGVDDSPAIPSEVLATWKCKTKVPRSTLTENDDARTLLGTVRRADPQIEERAFTRLESLDKFVKAAEAAKLLNGLRLSPFQFQEVADAITITLHSSDNAKQERAHRVLTQLHGIMDHFDLVDIQVLRPYDIALCSLYPAIASQRAVDLYSSKDDLLLRRCMVLDTSRTPLLKYKEKLLREQKKRMAENSTPPAPPPPPDVTTPPPPAPPEDTADTPPAPPAPAAESEVPPFQLYEAPQMLDWLLAATLGDSMFVENQHESLKREWGESPKIEHTAPVASAVAWTFKHLGNTSSRDILRRTMLNRSLRPEYRAEVIKALCDFDLGGFEQEALRILEADGIDQSSAPVLAAALQYLATKAKHKGRGHAWEKLMTYPHSDEVRRLAKSLQKGN